MKKKPIDERQKQELMQIEHIGFWVLFWSAFIIIIVKMFFFKLGIKDIIGETILVFLGGFVILIGGIKKGTWDWHTEPGLKISFAGAMIGGVFSAIATVFIRILRFNETFSNALIVRFGLVFAIVFFILFIFFVLYGNFIKHRRKKLSEKYDSDDEQNSE